jgi:hypothetical protein
MSDIIPRSSLNYQGAKMMSAEYKNIKTSVTLASDSEIEFDSDFCNHYYQSRAIVLDHLCTNCNITYADHWLDYYCPWYNQLNVKQCAARRPFSFEKRSRNKTLDYAFDLEKRLMHVIDDCTRRVDHGNIMYAFVSKYRARLAIDETFNGYELDCRVDFNCIMSKRKCPSDRCRSERVTLNMKSINLPIDVIADDHNQLAANINISLATLDSDGREIRISVNGGSRDRVSFLQT